MGLQKDRKGVSRRNGVRGVGYVVTLLGDEANMHALDPAKVHSDRIALHYAVLQWCSISYSTTVRPEEGGTGERGRNGAYGDLPSHRPVPPPSREIL